MVGLLRAELLKGLRRPLVWWLAAALVAATLLRGLAFPPAPNTPRVGLWSPGLVTVAVIILTAVTVGQEFSEGTFRGLVSRGLGRWQLLTAQWVVLVLAGGALLILVEGLAQGVIGTGVGLLLGSGLLGLMGLRKFWKS